jgi:hypothetical protein
MSTRTHPALQLAWRALDWARRSTLPWVALLVVAELILGRWHMTRPAGFDESYFVFEGWSVDHGLVPYRDFIEFKPPVVFWLNGLALWGFGVDGLRYRWMFMLLVLVATAALFVALCRRGADRVVAFVAVVGLAYALLLPAFHDAGLDDSETVGAAFFFLGCAALLWRGRRPAVADAVGGGMLALAALGKEPYALPALGAWVALGSLARDEQARSFRRYAKSTILGAALVVAPVVLYLSATGALGIYVRDMRLYMGYAASIGCPQPHSTSELVRQAWPHLTSQLLTPGLLAAALPLLIAFAVLPGTGFATRFALALTVLGGLFAVTLGGCYFRHYFTMGLTGLFLWSALGALVLSRRLWGASPDLRRWARVLLVAGAVAQMGPTLEAQAKAPPAPSATEATLAAPEVVRFVKENTKPDDYILADTAPALYVVTGRRAALRESCLLDELIPGGAAGATDEARFAPLRARLLERRPKVVYLSPSYPKRKVRTRQALIMPFLRELGYKQISPELYLRP